MAAVLFLVFTIQQVLDYWTTHKILSEGGKELNPIMRELMDIMGVQGALLAGKGLAILCGAYLSYHGFVIILGLLIAVYAYVLYNNFKYV